MHSTLLAFDIGTSGLKASLVDENLNVIRNVTTTYPTHRYPDGGCAFETYTNENMIEVESLSELKTVKAGETAVLTESWSLCKKPCDADFKNDKSIDEMLEKL